jgi:cobalt-zinc-cadmium efflux system outer membrane protein
LKITRVRPPGDSFRGQARALALAGLAVLTALPCAAQERDAALPVVGPSETLELFRRHSLELRAARSDVRAAAGRASQDAAYPNPSFSLLREDLSRGGQDYHENSFTLQQTVEWPGRTLARSRAASRTRAMSRSAFRSDSLRLVLEVRRAYLRAAEAERRVTVLEEVADVIREAVEDAEERRADGDISGYELRRLKLERARLEQRLAAGRIERDAARRELAARILPDSDTVAVATQGLPEGRPPEIGRRAALSAALRRPAVTAGRHAVEAADAEASAARLGRIPDLRLTGGYKTQADEFDGAVLGVSLSLPVFDRRGGAVQAAEAREAAATSRLELRRRAARNEVLRALDRYRSVRRRTRTVGDDLLAPSGELLEIARTAYAAGEMELVELLDGAGAHLESRLMALELRADLWLAYRELTRAMGGRPGRLGTVGRDDGFDREGDGR